MPKKRTWLVSDIFDGINIKLVHSEKKAQKILRDYHIISEIIPTDAQMWKIPNDDNEEMYLVYTERKDFSPETLGLLAHEATHIAQYFMEGIGEENPSVEFFAYVVQAATTNLLIQQREYIRKKTIEQP